VSRCIGRQFVHRHRDALHGSRLQRNLRPARDDPGGFAGPVGRKLLPHQRGKISALSVGLGEQRVRPPQRADPKVFSGTQG
jgi:hypothetical protein